MRAKIILKELLNNKGDGKPLYQVEFSTRLKKENGKYSYYTGKTSTTANFCRFSWGEGDAVFINWHETRAGNIIIDDVEPILDKYGINVDG